jgi:hypothetical protein
VPEGPEVSAWLQAQGARATSSGVEIDVSPANVGELAALASAFLAIAERGPEWTLTSHEDVLVMFTFGGSGQQEAPRVGFS